MKPFDPRSLANKYEAFDGQVTFWMMGYITMAVHVHQEHLERLIPRVVYRHLETGEEVTLEPESHKAARIEAEAFKKPIQCEWVREERWGRVEKTFNICDPLLVDMEFHLRADASKELRALEGYWQSRNGSVEHNYRSFCLLIGESVLLELENAFSATRDADMDAPEEQQMEKPDRVTDPLASSGGR